MGAAFVAANIFAHYVYCCVFNCKSDFILLHTIAFVANFMKTCMFYIKLKKETKTKCWVSGESHISSRGPGGISCPTTTKYDYHLLWHMLHTGLLPERCPSFCSTWAGRYLVRGLFVWLVGFCAFCETVGSTDGSLISIKISVQKKDNTRTSIQETAWNLA